MKYLCSISGKTEVPYWLYHLERVEERIIHCLTHGHDLPGNKPIFFPKWLQMRIYDYNFPLLDGAIILINIVKQQIYLSEVASCFSFLFCLKMINIISQWNKLSLTELCLPSDGISILFSHKWRKHCQKENG